MPAGPGKGGQWDQQQWPVMPSSQTSPANDPEAPIDPAAPADHPHNFDVQKELHQRIRNDPDYDDWEYGTEPLPHESEAWIRAQKAKAQAKDT
ncbi:hypothetical protein [Synechococcus sp. EJ6-Ellesmere]|nr:hypothetical protein [Synechococcus sp. EJ6-Ellesmere]